MTTYGAFRALIAGGSVAGLAAAFELRNIGAEALVFERSAGQMQTRGAGVVMQPEVEDLLNKMGRSARSVSVELVERQQLHHRKLPTRFHAPQLMTAWDTLYRALRATLPDECYSLGSRLTGFRRDDSGVTADFADGGTAHGDLLIGADGVGSATRRLIDPALQAHYSGYVAWRGLEDEAALPRDLVELLAGRFTFFGSSGLQMLSYLVPGPNGELDAGKRRVNWVWYMNIPSQSLRCRLTSKSGKQYKTFLPSQELAADTNADVVDLAQKVLPAQFADLVAHSQVFMQPVHDLRASFMSNSNLAVIGDAAGTVRPHTASGTSKAFGDASALAESLRGWDPARESAASRLEEWGQQRLWHQRHIARMGVELAARSDLGTVSGTQYLH